jgi:pyridine nucleotide-disulfide oxidoreductase domain-containing protein 1
MKQRIAVVVGGGVAGATCASELSARCADGDLVRVVLLTASPIVRVPIAGALRREVQVSDTPAESWATAASVSIVRGVATGISERAVLLADGTSILFDVCCLATGARPVLPAVLAADNPTLRKRILLVRDSDSVEVMLAAVAGARRVALVGNGGIGLELAYAINSCAVTWIIKDSYVGNSFFDARGGDALFRFLQRKMEENGDSSLPSKAQPHLPPSPTEPVMPMPHASPDFTLHSTGVGPSWLSRKEGPVMFDRDGNRDGCDSPATNYRNCNLHIERNCSITKLRDGDGDWPIALDLSNGGAVLCDVVICATGVAPNVEWLSSSFGENVILDTACDAASSNDASGGILVRAGNMQSTSRPDVFGAGDCVTVLRGSDMKAADGNNWFQMRLWTQAVATGRAAAAGMAAYLLGDGSAPDVGLEFELFTHVTRFFGQKVALLGRYNAQGLDSGYEVLEGGGGEGDDQFVRVVVEKGKVRGALLIGDTDLSETYENLILDQLDVGHLGAELVDPSIDLDDYFD